VKLERLYERPDLPAFHIPEPLRSLHDGDLGFQEPRVFANFVASVDGVVALPGSAESGGVISQGSEADHFLMGLLRACAGAVLIGAGTFRQGKGQRWEAESIYPAAAAAFSALRQKLGLSPRPLLVVVSASGDLDLAHPALQENAAVVTSPRGQARMGKAPSSLKVLVAPDTPIRLGSVLASLRALGARLILSEGGPTLIGQLIAEDLLDELFLTRSPLLLGRQKGDDRKALVEGTDLAAKGGTPLELLSVRRHASYLFFRYELPHDASSVPGP
jgi:riboflavin biosynthesis pyrimidine reductase